MKTKKFLALVLALVMAFSLVVPASANTSGEIPDQPAKLTHNGTETHDTAKMTVYVTGANQPTSVAAVGAINSHMDATLELNYGTYFFDGTITAYGQTEKKANMTTFTLDGTSNNTGIDFTTNSNGEGYYFPGLLDLVKDTPYYIQFVDAMVTTDGETIGNYTFTKTYTAEEKGITLTAKNLSTASLVDDNWQTLKAEAFVEDSDEYDDSYISLAAGSYIALNTEKLIVTRELELNNFSDSVNVQANIDKAHNNLMLATGTGLGYQILLKQGTRFKLGKSYADVTTDLLITMTGNEPFNTGDVGDRNRLGDIYTNLTDSGKPYLADNMLHLFSYIAGSVRSQDETNPVVITFGRPATEVATSESVVVDNDNGTTTTASTAFAVDTTGTTTTYNIKTDVTTTTMSSGESTTTTTTKPVDVVTKTAAEVASNVDSDKSEAAESAKNAVAAYSVVNNNSATFKAALTSSGTATAENVLQTTAAATAIAKAAANVAAENSETVSQITKAEVILQTVLKEVDTTNVTNPTVTYDIKPAVQLYMTVDDKLTAVGTPVELDNEDIKDGESFTFNIPVPVVLDTAKIKVTHKGENDETVIYSPTGEIGKVRYVEVTVSHFSEFELEKVVADPNASANCGFTLALNDKIDIPFYVYNLSTDASAYTVDYSYIDANNHQVHNTVNLEEHRIGETSNYRVVVASFSARQMADTVHVKLYTDASNPIYEDDYSIKQYCEGRINNSKKTDVIELCKATLDYGKAAQINFGYKPGTPVSENYYNNFTEVEIGPEYSGSNPAGFGFVGTTISLKSQVAINFYFWSGNDYTYTVNGKVVTPQESGSYKVIRVGGISAKNLDQQVTVTVSDKNNNSQDFSYSPMNYAYGRQEHSEDQNLINVCKALYLYCKCAKACLN